ncbi:CHRD domain-containing protein [Dyadobacter psychrotolerans]|uniref:CHRD domain-containing protein n=1 Tax=Dyadobacter psychrotolerans TaxID=2541721 RepID=A0A4R5DWK9_9BACT|nr:CHRD domain-containing protein [Dyadobacter psychrotolerans]TDE15675.1 CHRD domain-containing protein [Dyadobacter psychrotolerans]
MKKPMKRILLFMTGIAMLGMASSCKEEGPHKDDIVKFSATINSAPTVGTGAFEYNKVTRELSYNVSYSNIVPFAVTINHATPGWQRGPVLVNLPGFTASQVTGKTRVLTLAEQTELINGLFYVNIAPKDNPTKEVRGQILPNELD